MPAPLILLPTSERTTDGGLLAPAGPTLAGQLTRWRRELRAHSGVGVGRHVLPAAERYAGVVWEALDVASLSSAARVGLAASVVVVSPSHGLLGAAEQVGRDPLHLSDRLPPSASDARGRRAAPTTVLAFWRTRLPALVATLATGRPAFDLLPGAHADAVRLVPGPERWAVRVEKRVGGAPGQVISYDSKAVKGALVRHLLETGSTSPRELVDFEHRGYRVDPACPALAQGHGLLLLTGPGFVA